MAIRMQVTINKEMDLKKIIDYVKKEAHKAGVTFEGDTESGTFYGKISGSYKVTNSVVTLNITDKPWYVPESLVREKLRDLFKDR